MVKTMQILQKLHKLRSKQYNFCTKNYKKFGAKKVKLYLIFVPKIIQISRRFANAQRWFRPRFHSGSTTKTNSFLSEKRLKSISNFGKKYLIFSQLHYRSAVISTKVSITKSIRKYIKLL